MGSDVIEIEELYKSYGTLKVLRGLNLRVGAGEVYGLLGPNGVGKSTLIHVLLGFLKPSAGKIRLFGSEHPERMRGRIGYIPERQRYHTTYSAREYLRFIGKFSGLDGADLRERVEREIETVNLQDAADRNLGTFSKGMLQRVGVAQALLNDPDLLLIDEPTSGLDPSGQREVIDLLSSVRARGHTVFLCTHYLHEVEQLCDRVGVLANGQLVAEAVVAELRAPGTSVNIQVSGLQPEIRRQLEALAPGIICDAFRIQITQNTPETQSDVLRVLLDNNVAIIALDPTESPLERLYIKAVRGSLIEQVEHIAQENWGSQGATQPIGVRRSGEGDTLLNELLRRNNDQGSDS